MRKKIHTQTVCGFLAPILSLLLDYQESPSEWDVFFSCKENSSMVKNTNHDSYI